MNYINNNPIINININYNPIYYNIINNINSNQKILRKNIKTPEVNRIKLREKIYNKMNKKRNNNLDIDYFSNGINKEVSNNILLLFCSKNYYIFNFGFSIYMHIYFLI